MQMLWFLFIYQDLKSCYWCLDSWGIEYQLALRCFSKRCLRIEFFNSLGTAIFVFRYDVLRSKLLLEMLRNCIGSGIWQTFTETEKQEKLFQLKMKEEKIRKENNLERMVICLPGAGLALDYNLLAIMGESLSQLEKRITEQQKKADESGMWLPNF